MKARRPPNIFVVGCGHWGKNLARIFNKLGRLYAVCESDAGRLETFREQYQAGEVLSYDAVEPLQAECEHFIDCVTRGLPPARTSGEDGVGVLQVLQACLRSLQMNGDPVQVTLAAAQSMSSL